MYHLINGQIIVALYRIAQVLRDWRWEMPWEDEMFEQIGKRARRYRRQRFWQTVDRYWIAITVIGLLLFLIGGW